MGRGGGGGRDGDPRVGGGGAGGEQRPQSQQQQRAHTGGRVGDTAPRLSEYMRQMSGAGAGKQAQPYDALRRSLLEMSASEPKQAAKTLLQIMPRMCVYEAPDGGCLLALVSILTLHTDRTILRLAALLLSRSLHRASTGRNPNERTAAAQAARRLAQFAIAPQKPTSLEHVKRVYSTRALAGVPARVLEEATGERAHALPLRILEAAQHQKQEASKHKRDKLRQHLLGIATLERAALQLAVTATGLSAGVVNAGAGAQRAKDVDAALSMAALGLHSADAAAARHAALLLLNAAEADPAAAEAAAAQGSPLLAALRGVASAQPGQAPEGRRPSNPESVPFASVLGDTLARGFLARAAACVLLAASVGSPAGGACSALLGRFASDPSPSVCLEAICGLVGARGLKALSAPDKPNTAATEAPKRAKAWLVLAADGALAQRVIARVERCLALQSRPTLHAACRAASALLEARVHAGKAAAKCAGHAQADAAVASLVQTTRALVACESYDVRAAAMEALVWAVDDKEGAALRPADFVDLLHREVNAGGWHEGQVDFVFYSVATRVRASPSVGPGLVRVVARCARAVSQNVTSEAAEEIWQAGLSTRSKQAMCKAAVVVSLDEVLAQPPPPPSIIPSKAKQAAENGRAWIRLQRCAASFLGENANYAAGEYAWQDRPVPIVTGGPDTEDASLSHVASCEAANPILSAAIERLECLLAEGVWEVRASAARALAKIAVRSGEPFRLAIYRALRAVSVPSIVARSAGGRGLSAVAGPAVRLLDDMYAAQEELLARVARARESSGGDGLEGDGMKFGREDRRWIRDKHEQLMARIPSVAFVPANVYLPLGRKSVRALGRRMEMAGAKRASEGAGASLGLQITPADTRIGGLGAASPLGVGVHDQLGMDRPAPQDVVVCVQPFQGEEEGELTVAVGERFVRVPNDAEGWVLLEGRSGSLGLVPEWAVEPANVDSPPPMRARGAAVAATAPAPRISDASEVASPRETGAAVNAALEKAAPAPVQSPHMSDMRPSNLFGEQSPERGLHGGGGALHTQAHAEVEASSSFPATDNFAAAPPGSEAFSAVMGGDAQAGAGNADDDDVSVDGEPVMGRALYDFEAAAEGELSVSAHEDLHILYEVEGWYFAVKKNDFPHATDRGGLVPETYIEVEDED